MLHCFCFPIADVATESILNQLISNTLAELRRLIKLVNSWSWSQKS